MTRASRDNQLGWGEHWLSPRICVPSWASVISPAKWGDTACHFCPSSMCILVQATIIPHLGTMASSYLVSTRLSPRASLKWKSGDIGSSLSFATSGWVPWRQSLIFSGPLSLPVKRTVYSFARAAVIKYHRQGRLSIRSVFSHNSED